MEGNVKTFQLIIKDAENLIARYKQQLENVKNDREYKALAKEVEFQELEIQLHNKKIKEAKIAVEQKQATLDASTSVIEKKEKDLENKRKELEEIIAKTEKEEGDLMKKSEKAASKIEERLVKAYNRIRNAYRNGLSVVTIERDSCGGCFNQVPPQLQLEIRLRKKMIFCEHCGRMLVDEDIAGVAMGKTGSKRGAKHPTGFGVATILKYFLV